MAIPYTTLFTQLGRVFRDQEVVNAFRLGTTSISNVFTEIDGSNLNVRRALNDFQNADLFRQSSLDASIASSKQVAETLVIETVNDNSAAPLTQKNIGEALKLLIREMTADSQSVKNATLGNSIGTLSGSSAFPIILNVKRPDGLTIESTIAEIVQAECTSAADLDSVVFTLTGKQAVTDKLAHNWPAGSGLSLAYRAQNLGDSLLLNTGFDDEDDLANAPDDWYISVGTVGTTIKMTDYEVQTIVITGTPTTGTYRISWANASGKVQVTTPLAYNADGATVQAALNAMAGLETVTVVTTGTSPDYTHTITFTGLAGNHAQFTIVSNTTGGTITPSTTTAGSANAYTGRAVEFDSDGSQLTTLNQEVSLSPLTHYAIGFWAMVDVVPAAGVVTIDLVDGIGGSVVNDSSGNAISQAWNANSFTTSFASRTFSFVAPSSLPSITYLRFRISTAISNTTSFFLDHMIFVPMTELYAGGPRLAILASKTLPQATIDTIRGDNFTITTTNTRGKFQQYFEANFGLMSRGLQLPVNGSPTQADTLIA